MKCPSCRTEYVCPCRECRERQPDKIPWKFEVINDLELETCPGCGLTKDSHEWAEIEWNQYKAMESQDETT